MIRREISFESFKATATSFCMSSFKPSTFIPN